MKTRTFPRRTGIAIALCLLLLGIAGVGSAECAEALADPSSGTETTSAPAGPPNVVIILTDDQRWDTLWAMPKVRTLLGEPGVTFDEAFVVNPVCCPSRASFLTGNYSHTTKVYGNRSDRSQYGGFANFDDASTLATWLDPTYDTALFGRYLNGYGKLASDYIPPGWDRWAAFVKSGYYDFSYNSDGACEDHAGDGVYSTDDLANKADAFIRSSDEPVFVYLALSAPHDPSIPAPEDADLYTGLPPWRPPSYNEAAFRDKPSHGGFKPRLLSSAAQVEVDETRLNQLRTLAAADRAVETVVTALEETGRLDNSLIVFASDNGFMWGEHRLSKKNNPYEESIRIPLIVRYDAGVADPGVHDDHLVANIDLAPTILELTGIEGDTTDGMSLVPLLTGTSTAWRDELLIEHGYVADSDPSFCELRTKRYMFTVWADRKVELYDLEADPYQLENLYGTPAGTAIVNGEHLRDRLRALCRPLPPQFPNII